jgi:hypothetical protein
MVQEFLKNAILAQKLIEKRNQYGGDQYFEISFKFNKFTLRNVETLRNFCKTEAC